MNKKSFLEMLKNRISHLPHSDVEKAITFYSESIDDRIEDGMSEIEAIESLGDIQEIADNIEQSISIPILVKEKIKESHNKSSNKALWITLIVLGSPIWGSIAFAVISVIFSIYLAIGSVIFSIYAVIASTIFSGGCGLVAGVIEGVTSSLVSGVMMIGIALSILGLGLIAINPMNYITMKLIKLNKNLILKIKSMIFRKKKVI